ncbi:MAG TPA: discoidin domain-containing protein [Herpetosiphonaceae bacterium]
MTNAMKKTAFMLPPLARTVLMLLALITGITMVPTAQPMQAASSMSQSPQVIAPPTPGAQLWLRADAGVTASAGKVSAWADQSGAGNHASMTTTSRQPALIENTLNNLPVLRFNGAQSLTLSTPVSPRTFTIFIVGKNSKSTETYSMILGPGGSSPNNQLRWENGSQVLVVGSGNNLPTTRSSIGNTRVYHALMVRYDGATLTFYRDGSLISSHTLTTSGPWTLAQIGAYYSSSFMTGDIAEILIYPTALIEADRNRTNSYLHQKYALSDDVLLKARLQQTMQPVLTYAQNLQFRNLVYNGIARRFDGDDNILLSTVIQEAEQAGIVDPNAPDWQSFKAQVAQFQDVNGSVYYPQIYIPNFGEVAPDSTGVSMVVYETDLSKTHLTAYQVDSTGNLRPKTDPVDETYTETYEVWVLSVNERIDPDTPYAQASDTDRDEMRTASSTMSITQASTQAIACNPTGIRNNKGMEYLQKFKVPSPSSVEHWTAGKLEPRLVIVGNGGAELKNAYFGKIKRRTIRNWYTTDLFITTWDRATWGNYWAYKWVEIDGGPKVEISLGLSATILQKIDATAGVKAIIEKRYDDMGAAVVGFEESTFIQYGTGTVDWMVCSVGGEGGSGDENLARSAIAAASSTYPYDGYAPSRVNDGSRTTTVGGAYSWVNADRYAPDGYLPQWVQLDFGTTKTFSRVVMYTSSGYPIQDYDIQVWDGSTWVTVDSRTGNTALTVTHTFAPTTARLVRILGRRGPSNQPQYVRVNEFEVYP